MCCVKNIEELLKNKVLKEDKAYGAHGEFLSKVLVYDSTETGSPNIKAILTGPHGDKLERYFTEVSISHHEVEGAEEENENNSLLGTEGLECLKLHLDVQNAQEAVYYCPENPKIRKYGVFARLMGYDKGKKEKEENKME